MELMLQQRLFRSDKTGKIIEGRFLYFSYPYRWYYDVLRGLGYFQRIRVKRDGRLAEAIELLTRKSGRTKPGPSKTCMPENHSSRWNKPGDQAGKIRYEPCEY
jgi:hypothetical protein